MVPFLIGGVIQGRGLMDSNVPFIDAIRSVLPFIGLSTLGIMLLLLAGLALLLNLGRLMTIGWRACCGASSCGVRTEIKNAAAAANL